MSTASEKPVLMVTEGELRGQRWVMHGDTMTIGRGGEADIVLPDTCFLERYTPAVTAHSPVDVPVNSLPFSRDP